MEEENQDSLKKLIQQSGPEKPAMDFTQGIMQMISAEELAAEQALSTLLTKYTLERPSVSFQAQLMGQILPEVNTVEKPIISNKAWYFIAAGFALLITLSFFVSYPQTAAVTTLNLSIVGSSLGKATMAVGNLPMMYPIVITTLCCLMMADYFIRIRLVKN